MSQIELNPPVKPKISIVVPTFNQGRYIRQCLESLASQTEKDFEVLIQDSCSNDDTEAICLEFASRDERFKYFREKDSGQSDALNRGLRRSHGIFWTWICSDDFYANAQALEKLTASLPLVFDANVSWAGSFGAAELVSESGSYLDEYITLKRPARHQDFKTLWPFSQPASMLYRNLVIAAGSINAELHFGMDLDLFIRLTATGLKFKYIPEKIASVRVQPDSKSVRDRMDTAKCALGIVRFYYGGVGFPPFSRYSVELGWSRLETLKGSVKHWKAQLHRGETPPTLPGEPSVKQMVLKSVRHAGMMPVHFGFKLLARYVLSINLGRFFSYELLSARKSA